MLDLVRDLSLALRDRVLPSVGSHAASAHETEADAAGGDVTFAIDADAEAFLADYLAVHAPDIAFYSEDRGLVDGCVRGRDPLRCRLSRREGRAGLAEAPPVRLSGNERLDQMFWTYDLAGAALVLEQAGAVVTDAYGASLGDRLLLGSGEEFQMSIVASANRRLHDQILREVDRGVTRLLG